MTETEDNAEHDANLVCLIGCLEMGFLGDPKAVLPPTQEVAMGGWKVQGQHRQPSESGL